MSNYGPLWIKYRTLHAAGPSSWQFEEVEANLDQFAEDRDKELTSIARGLNEELNTGSILWRGVEVEVELPPADILKKKIGYLKQAMSREREALKRWRELEKTL